MKPISKLALRLFAPVSLLIVSSSVSAQTWGSHGFNIYAIPADMSVDNTGIVNNSGQVAVTYWNQALGLYRPAIFNPVSAVQYLDGLNDHTDAYALSINNNGVVTGENYDLDTDMYSGFIADMLSFQDLPDFISEGLNESGGSAGSMYSNELAAVWNGSSFVTGPEGGFFDINNAGIAVGYRYDDYGTVAVSFDGTTTTDLVLPEGTYSSVATAVNNSNQTVGYAYIDGTIRAFLNSGGSTSFLGCGCAQTIALDVDDSGRAVGLSTSGDGAAFWENGNQYFLSALQHEGPWDLYGPIVGISDNGRYMVASGYNYGTGVDQYVLIEERQSDSVTPEPISMTLLGTGLAGIAAARRRRKVARA